MKRPPNISSSDPKYNTKEQVLSKKKEGNFPSLITENLTSKIEKDTPEHLKWKQDVLLFFRIAIRIKFIMP